MNRPIADERKAVLVPSGNGNGICEPSPASA